MTTAAIQTRIFLPAITLTWREFQRFVRQRSRIIGALGTPIVFWILIGAGLGHSFRVGNMAGEVSYLKYFFPGTFALIVLFTAIFSSISIIEDRHEGFLQAVLVAPVSRLSIALGKIMGSTLLAVLQGLIFLLLAPTIGVSIGPSEFLQLLLAAVLVAFALSGLGFLVAWKLDSMQGFHSVMNLLLIPMWILSGALFPASGASAWLKWILRLNPLTYGVAAIRHALYPTEVIAAGESPGQLESLIVIAAFGLVMFLLAGYLIGREKSE